MKLYNTLTRTVEDITPQNAPVVTVYTCGPTVYDFPHVGNWFTFIRYDLLIRTLKASGYKPEWVMNITDVGHLVSDADEGEDKLEKGARREHKSAWDVAAYYGNYFVAGLDRLNITKPNYLPKATEHVTEQIDLIRQLEAKGYTYAISDGVYYDTAKFPRYADFARLDLDEQQPGARVDYNPEKRHPTDFALWKLSPSDHQRDMEWDSPWGRGFPGWHIECSAMSRKYLGDTIDIHAGGIDHVPVHHTNEIAQSEPVTGKPLAHIWMHSNHISIEGEKISKSLGNGFTLEDVEAHNISLPAFRLHVLESHYRSQSKFSWLSLEAAQNRLTAWRQVAALQWQPKPALHANEESILSIFHDAFEEILSSLEDDLGTPQAIATVSDILDVVKARTLRSGEVEEFQTFLQHIDAAFGLDLASIRDIAADQKVLISKREQAREDRDWQQADKYRAELEAQGIGLNDTAHGAVWFWQ